MKNVKKNKNAENIDEKVQCPVNNVGENKNNIVFYDIDDLFKEEWYDFLFRFIHKIKKAWETFYCKFKFGWKAHIINTRLTPSYWYDTDERMLYGMMNLLVEYVDGEEPFELIDWRENQSVENEIKKIYHWWKVCYPALLKDEELSTSEWYDYSKTKKQTGYSEEKEKELLGKSWKIEQQRENEEQDMLLRLVKIRKYLWT